MERRVRLRDGTRAVVRPFVPRSISREAIEDAYEHLSPESQFHRFLTAVPHLTDTLLHQLVDEVDGVDHIALLLVVEPESGVDSIVGVARIVRYPERPTDADVAVTVRDEWHGRGVATALLAELMRCRPAGVTRLVTQVAVDNEAALRMLARLGTTEVTPAGRDALEVVVALPEHESSEVTPTPR